MIRIYQGKITHVEVANPNKKAQKEKWLPFDPDPKIAREKWQAALWNHHELFQDAVNYYTLALAAMAEGLQPDSPKGKAALAWHEQVRSSWLWARRKAVRFPGPHVRLSEWLGVNPAETDTGKAFDASADALFKNSPATVDARAKALLQILEEVDQSDLNQFCVSRLPWLCTPHGKLDATPRNIAQQQERRMLAIISDIHEASVNQLTAVAEKLELDCFVTQIPKKSMNRNEAHGEAMRLFRSASAKAKGLIAIADKFTKRLHQLGDKLALPCLGRRPKGAYPFAVVLKLFPEPETWEAFKNATQGLRKRSQREETKGSPHESAEDFIADVRTADDQPVFDYFSNRAFFREPGNDDRAVWFEFDLAAFIEAIKSPHRYFQDTLKRDKAAELLRKKKRAMEGCGGETGEDHDEEDEEPIGTFGFEGDKRIKLLRELVKETLGYIAEAEHPDEEAEQVEYMIQERTLRGFTEIREKWRKLADKDQATEEKLLDVLTGQQAKHRDDFGSATLYRALAQPKFHPIWRDAGTEKWHAADPLKAWQIYKELCFELQDKERPIRFTPAHAEHSPRYFIIPKQGRFRSNHTSGQLAFICGIALNTTHGWEAKKVRVIYSAPRLLRDDLRCDGKEDLESVPWLQPMMKALELPEVDVQDFANCRVTLQPETPKDIQLTFPVEVDPEKLITGLGKAKKWNRQFNLHPGGDKFYNASLRWPHEKHPANPPEPWHEQEKDFNCVAIDLGQRDAGAFARLSVSCDKSDQRPMRFIGSTGSKQWRAALERSGLFRLPGEDALVWRGKSKLDGLNPDDSGKPFDFRQELWGERGRPARKWEADETAELMRLLEASPEAEEFTVLPDGWRDSLSFPEQNDKLMVAMRRYQSRIARLHRWCWFLKCDEKRKRTAWEEIYDCDDVRLVTPELKETAQKRDPRAEERLESQLRDRLKLAPILLVRIANRILPLRGRSWHWGKHPDSMEKNTLHQLTQNGPSLDSKEKPTWLRGQRGLSMERIEQIKELRRRFQSLNQILRREIGEKPPIRRDESVPDPCPDLLDKLDNLKDQRVNQTAHMILAEALGLRLAAPPADKKILRQRKDQHGVYEKILDKKGRWIGPVDFIVIEDLSRYRASQGRAPRENSRLMKWCHRAVRDKLKQLCEIFGLPVLETPAAYSSRFCSRSGVAGFRAVEVAPGFENHFPWSWLKEKMNGDHLSEDAQKVQELIKLAKEANQERNGGHKKYRTFLAPLAGGPIFVPIVDKLKDAEIQPAVMQADINAAINLGLRAIADPRLWSIHPRLRTKREGDGKTAKEKEVKAKHAATPSKLGVQLLTREKRKFGEQGKQLEMGSIVKGSALENTRQPNFFADLTGIAKWDVAKIEDPLNGKPFMLVSGKALWSAVKELQWKRISEINAARAKASQDKTLKKAAPVRS